MIKASRSCSNIQHPELKQLRLNRKCNFSDQEHRILFDAIGTLEILRTLILRFLPNLIIFVTEEEADWSYDLHPGDRFTPFTPSLQNLKTPKMVRNENTAVTQIRLKNVTWLLFFLPSLQHATLHVLPEKENRPFLELHSEVCAGKSNLKELFLHVVFQYDLHRPEVLFKGSSKTLAVKRFLSITKSLVQAEILIGAGCPGYIPEKFKKESNLVVWKVENLLTLL